MELSTKVMERMVVDMINNSNDSRNLTLEACPLGVLYEAFCRYDDVTSLYATSLNDGAKRVEYVEVGFKVSGNVRFSIEPVTYRPFVFFVSWVSDDYHYIRVNFRDIAYTSPKNIAAFVAACVRDLAFGVE